MLGGLGREREDTCLDGQGPVEVSPTLQQMWKYMENPITQLSYNSVESMTFSARRAVHASFRLRVCPSPGV